MSELDEDNIYFLDCEMAGYLRIFSMLG